jgi:hypothetical protein
VRGLVKEAIQMEEDIALAAFASKREREDVHEGEIPEACRDLVIVSFELRDHPEVKSADIPLPDAKTKERIKLP